MKARVSTLLLAAILFPTATASPKTRTIHGPSVPVAVDAFRFNDVCVDVLLYLSAGDFFEGLQMDVAEGAVKFHKGALPIEQFPDQITLEIQAGVRNCQRLLGAPIDPTIGRELMQSIRFEAQWKDDKKFQKAEIFSVESSRPDLQEMHNLWDYEIKLNGGNMPISDDLVVSILSRQGDLLRRISVSLVRMNPNGSSTQNPPSPKRR